MFGSVAAFEFRQQLRAPLFWIVVAVFFLLVFGFMATDRISIGDTANVHKNSPFSIAQTHLVMSLFFLFVATAFVGGAMTRDEETGFGPIVRATPLSKFDSLYGRFCGAFAAALLAFLAVTAAMIVGAVAPWADPERLGAFRPDAYAWTELVLVWPSLLVGAALAFVTASATRSLAWTFVAMLALIVLYAVAGVALGKPDAESVIARWDPVGLFAFDVATRYFTAADRNSLLPPLHGVLLFDRVFVLLLASALLALTYPLTRYREAAARPGAAKTPEPKPRSPVAITLPRAAPSQGLAANWSRLAGRARFDMAQVFRGPVFSIVLLLGLANAFGSLWSSTDDARYGAALLPVTRILLPILDGSFSLFAIVIAGYYAGELVWRDRERRAHEMIDATPAPDWTFVLPKTLAVSVVLIAAILASVAAAMLVQALKGWFHFEPAKYLLWYVAPQAADLIILAALAVFLQVISPNKFVGWGGLMLYIVALFALPGLGVEHNLIIWGGTNPVPLSDMNGQGRFWIGAWWMRLYWGAAALLALIAAHALWRRGADVRLWLRLARAPRRLKGAAGWLGLAAAALMAGVGVWIFVNTNVWNPYRTTRGDEAWQAAYEKTLLPFENLPKPSVVAVRLTVDIHPGTPRLDTRGDYVLENRSGAPLREVHIRFDRDLDVRALSVEGARPTRVYDRFNYRIFTFDTPMAPGERRTLSFDTRLTERGFRNARRATRDLTSVVANGTFVNAFEIGPVIGMSRDRLLTDRARRRELGLPAELHLAPPGDARSRGPAFAGNLDWARSSDITVTTDADQTPIAPGETVSDTTVGGRRTVRFVARAPILNFFSIQSARYAVRTVRHSGVDLSVYYDPQHATNVARMLRALAAALDYYQANFGPYQFRQARIVEFPDYAQFAQSFAGTFPWSEGLGFIADYRDPSRIDMVTYVAAHELAHQWWAHQMIGADQQGATALTETLAQYSALRVMRRLYGPAMVRKFLKFELDSYLRARGTDPTAEQPLERVEDQPYIHYRKGSLVMYRLAEEIGEDKVNAALRDLLARYRFNADRYPTSLDLVAALRAQAPADKQVLIGDLFERITLYDLRATQAITTRRPDGTWSTRISVSATKLNADGHGRETPEPMAETPWIGLFSARPDADRFSPADVIALERRPVHDGVQSLDIVSRRRPAFAAVDPFVEMIQRAPDRGIVAVRAAR